MGYKFNIVKFVCVVIGSLYSISFLTFAQTTTSPVSLKLGENKRSVTEFFWEGMYQGENLMNYDRALGEIEITYNNVKRRITDNSFGILNVISEKSDNIQLLFNFPGNIDLKETFRYENNAVYWEMEFINKSGSDFIIQDLSVALPFARLEGMQHGIPARDILSPHYSITGNPSFCYWLPVRGDQKIMLMTMLDDTYFEYFESYFTRMYMHSSTSVNRTTDTWRIPSTIGIITPGKTKKYGFKFQLVNNNDALREKIYEENGLDVRVIPGMTISNDMDIKCSFRTKEEINEVIAEFPATTSITKIGEKEDYHLYNIKFNTLGENTITVKYGNGKIGYFDFFVTEPIETLIKKRAKFITEKQHIKDKSKWYDGLYSLWNADKDRCLSPDYYEGVQYEFFVGGSDDPSNGKPLYISEKNTIYPNQEEIAALEYYEENFVWGKLQRTDQETPYPYGIYGIPNWYELRSGKLGGYGSGGDGLERMWRSFDYTTHFATYFNLYRIARDYPDMVKYLDAKGYLDRAYHTAMAYFEVPYNIYMGNQWLHHGYNDWAYKIGNIHERYLLPLISELEKNGEMEKANTLRLEWEKKVTFMIYEDKEWLFIGSEGALDRTSYETTYYVCEYAKEHPIKANSKQWYDKNKGVWYSHPDITNEYIDKFLKKQLHANLALRRIIEPGYSMLGSYTFWYNLEYMTQLGGIALCDYAAKFSENTSKYMNIGYNSLLGAWALINSGPDGKGYWYTNPEYDGYAGWLLNPWQADGFMYKRGITHVCAEVEHGLSGAIHSITTYIIDDPIWGIVSYGGELTSSGNQLKVIPKDGVRRRVAAIINNRSFHIELKQDGFERGSEIEFSNDLGNASFFIESRNEQPHETTILLSHLRGGEYSFWVNGQEIQKFQINDDTKTAELPISITKNSTKVEIKMENALPTKEPVAGVATATSNIIFEGGTTMITLKDYFGVIQWQESIDGKEWKDILNEKNETLNVFHVENKKYFRAAVSNETLPAVYSNIVCIEVVSSNPVATASALDICANDVVEITLTNYIGEIEWQFSTEKLSWTPIANQNSDLLIIKDLTEKTSFRAVLTLPENSGQIYSNEVTINVIENLNSGRAIARQNVIPFNTSAQIELSEYSGYIQWQESQDGINFSDIENATGPIYTTAPLTEVSYFRAYTKGGSCTSSPSNIVKISFSPNAIILEKETLSLALGEKTRLTYTISPEGVENQSVKWSSENSEIASVLPDGTITANSLGTTVITATTIDGLVSASCHINVTEKNDELNIFPNPAKDRFVVSNVSGWDLIILDGRGKKIFADDDISDEYTVYTTHFKTGVYVVIAQKGDEKKVTKLRITK